MLGNWISENTATTGAANVGLVISLGGAVTSDVMAFSARFATGDVVQVSLKSGNNRQSIIGTLASGTPWTLTVSKIIEKWDGGAYSQNPSTGITLAGTSTVEIDASTTSILPAQAGKLAGRSTTKYYSDPFCVQSNNTGRSLNAGRVWITPFFVVAPMPLNGIGCIFNAVATTGTVVQYGLYKANELTNALTIIAQTGTINALTAPLTYNDATFATPQMLQPGLCYIGLGSDSNAIVNGQQLYAGNPFMPQLDGKFSVGAYFDGVYVAGTMPASLGNMDNNSLQIGGGAIYPALYGVQA